MYSDQDLQNIKQYVFKLPDDLTDQEQEFHARFQNINKNKIKIVAILHVESLDDVRAKIATAASKYKKKISESEQDEAQRLIENADPTLIKNNTSYHPRDHFYIIFVCNSQQTHLGRFAVAECAANPILHNISAGWVYAQPQ